MRHIFSLGTLPIEGDFDPSQNIYPVKTDRFKDYAAFETYIRSIYTKEWADTLLNNYPYEGVQKYLNKDGKLYVDMNYDAGKGYYVDWSEYTVEIVSQTETKCDFKLTAQIEEPAAEPVKTDYVVEGSAYLENGTWLFDKIYS